MSRVGGVLRTKYGFQLGFSWFDAGGFIFDLHFLDFGFHSEFFDFDCGKTTP